MQLGDLPQDRIQRGLLCQLFQPRQLVRQTGQQIRLSRASFQQHHVPQLFQQFVTKPHHVLGLVVEGTGAFQCLCRVLCLHCFQNGEHAVPTGNAGCRRNRCRGDRFAAGRTLIQQGQRITHTAVRQVSDQLCRLRLQRKLLLAGDIFQPCRNVRGADPVKVVPLAA